MGVGGWRLVKHNEFPFLGDIELLTLSWKSGIQYNQISQAGGGVHTDFGPIGPDDMVWPNSNMGCTYNPFKNRCMRLFFKV